MLDCSSYIINRIYRYTALNKVPEMSCQMVLVGVKDSGR